MCIRDRDNTLQDILIRWHRMMGHNTLWMPGYDHAGLATQIKVEEVIKKEEGKTLSLIHIWEAEGDVCVAIDISQPFRLFAKLAATFPFREDIMIY